MKNLLKTSGLILALCFSVYCFCFINTQAVNTAEPITKSQTTIQEVDDSEKKTDVYFPDLKFVAKVSQVLSQIFKVI